MNTVNTKTARKVKAAFKAAGYTAVINGSMFGYEMNTRGWWFNILPDGSLLFNHAHSPVTGITETNLRTAQGGYNRIERISGVAVCETIN